MSPQKKNFKAKVLFSLVVLVTFIMVGFVVGVTNIFAEGGAATTTKETVEPKAATDSGALSFGLIAAAIAFGLGAIGAGIAIGNVGSAAMGAISEKPEMFGQALIFVALAEGLVVFGFITALMILGKV